jgi:DNA-directed RNA polymerase III subunit RPC8
MFVEVVLKDTIRIPPSDFNKPLDHVLQDQLHAQYANKVIGNLGLCIAVSGIDSFDKARLFAGMSRVVCPCTQCARV